MITAGIPLDQWSGSKATEELHNTIKQFNKISSKQNTRILILTWIIAILTFIMAIAVSIQIWIAIKQYPLIEKQLNLNNSKETLICHQLLNPQSLHW